MENESTNSEKNVILEALNKMIVFQQKWRRISMLMYVTTAVGTIICSASGTIFGALDNGKVAAILAAIATVFVSVEKGFLFREKWKLHLTIETRLHNIKLGIDVNQYDPGKTVESMHKIMEDYSKELPIAPRE